MANSKVVDWKRVAMQMDDTVGHPIMLLTADEKRLRAACLDAHEIYERALRRERAGRKKGGKGK